MLESLFGSDTFGGIVDEYLLEEVEEQPVEIAAVGVMSRNDILEKS